MMSGNKIVKKGVRNFGEKINSVLPDTGESASENTAVLYDASFCMYILSYAYDLETNELTYDYQKILSVYTDNKHLFKDREHYLSCLIAYADYFNNAEELKKFILNSFGIYLLTCEAEEKLEIISFLSTEYTFLAKPDLHKLYFSMFSVGNVNDEPLSNVYESDGVISTKSISDIISISDSIVLSNTSSLDDLKAGFGIYPKTLQTDSFYTHLYYTDEYIIVFYGNPVFSVTVYDIKTAELVYYHSKTIDGYYVQSEVQSDKTGDDTVSRS